MSFQPVNLLLEQDGDGICFLAGGTAADPDPDRCAGRFADKEGGDDLGLKLGKGLRVTEEVGDPDQQIEIERL